MPTGPARNWRCEIAQTFDAKYEQEVIDLAKGRLESYEQGIRTSMGKTPTGAATPSDEDLAAFFFHQQVLYPPQLFTYPDGHQVFASPWILALEFCDNGREWLAKFDRFRAKAGI